MEVGQEGGRNTGENLKVVPKLHLEWEVWRSGLPRPQPRPLAPCPQQLGQPGGSASAIPETRHAENSAAPDHQGLCQPSASAQPVPQGVFVREGSHPDWP